MHLNLDSFISLRSLQICFRYINVLGKDLTTKLHTWGAVCRSLLHWQCRTTLGMLYTLTEAVRVRIPNRVRVTLLVLYTFEVPHSTSKVISLVHIGLKVSKLKSTFQKNFLLYTCTLILTPVAFLNAYMLLL